MAELSSLDPTLAAALRFADNDCPVFPVRAPIDGACSCPEAADCDAVGKHPHIRGWPTEASTDPEQIRAWAHQWPSCNFGALTGPRSGLIDIETDGEAGSQSLLEAETRYGRLPDTKTFRSPSGSVHSLYAYPTDGREVRNSQGKIGRGVDVRGFGGMFMIPGSVHRSGQRYVWIEEDGPIAELPRTWLDALATPPRAMRSDDGAHDDGPPAEFAPIMAGCRFLQHVRDDAATLSEQDWWIGIGIAARTVNGIEHAHELSAPYPRYDIHQTQRKAERAFAQNMPHTCDRIAELTDGASCEGCPHRGTIRSPVWLGRPRPVLGKAQTSGAPGNPPALGVPQQPLGHVLPFRTAREIGTYTPERPDWIVEGFLATSAITELDGKAKAAGKTTFVTAMSKAILTGTLFLGRPAQQSPVVYLSEQTPTTLREPLRRADLLDHEDLVVLCWGDTVGIPWTAVAEAAVAQARHINARVLIVDTMPQFSGIRGDNENDSGAALEAMRPLQIAAAAGLAVLMVRHYRKSGGEVGESGRGSSAYAGSVDIVLQLARGEGQSRPTIRQISALSRFDETPAKLVIEWTEQGYVPHGDGSAVKTDETRKALLDGLPTNQGDAVVIDDLAKAVDASQTLVKRIVTELVNDGAVVREGKGVKGDPYRFWRASPFEMHSNPPTSGVVSERIPSGESAAGPMATSSAADSPQIHSDTTATLGGKRQIGSSLGEQNTAVVIAGGVTDSRPQAEAENL
jgi:hypothetical protein